MILTTTSSEKQDDPKVRNQSHRCCCPQRQDQPFFDRILESDHAPSFDITDMSFVPSGSFRMGSNIPMGFEDGEGPIRIVHIDSFMMDDKAVSNIEFSRFIKETKYITDAERIGWSYIFAAQLHPASESFIVNRSVVEAPWWLAVKNANWRTPDGPGSSIIDKAEHPVVHVSWNDASAFAKWSGKRLPTECEWEKAARGGFEDRLYPWGNELLFNGKHQTNIWQGDFPQVNTGEDGYFGTAPVNSFEPNGFGLFNMSGNVWEWCSDWWSSSWHKRDLKATRINPRGPDSGVNKVIRGGSFLCHASYCERYRVSARTQTSPNISTSHIGFRCALDL